MASVEAAFQVVYEKLKDLYEHVTSHANKLAALEKRVAQLEEAEKEPTRNYRSPLGREFEGVTIDDFTPDDEPVGALRDEKLRRALWDEWMAGMAQPGARAGMSFSVPPNPSIQFPESVVVGQCECGGVITQTSPWRDGVMLMAKFGKSCKTCGTRYD